MTDNEGQKEPTPNETGAQPTAESESAPTPASAEAATPLESTDELIRQRDQYLDLARRARADLENYQKRVAREAQTERRYAAQPVIADLLPALDNLDRAIESADNQADAKTLLDGVRLVRKLILDALIKHGVTEVDPLGQPFDPHLHEAVTQFPSVEVEPMTVLQTLRKGYRLHDRVIRPANVVVSKAPDA